MNEGINLALLGLVLAIGCGFVCFMFSPDLMEITARKIKARAKGLRASREHFRLAHRESIHDDLKRESERASFDKLFSDN